MKRRWKVLPLALVAVLAISVVASASASAATQHWYTGGSKLVGSTGETSSGSNFVLKSRAGGVTITINCTTEANSGTITNPSGGGAGTFAGSITFSGCTVEPTAQACKAHSPGEPVGTIKVGSVNAEATEKELKEGEKMVNHVGVLFSPSSGTTFVEIVLEGCKTSGLNKTYNVTGTDFGIALNSSSSLEFTTASSFLSFGGEPATLTGVSVQKTSPGNLSIEVKP